MTEVTRRGPSGPASDLLLGYDAQNLLYVAKYGDNWLNDGLDISRP